jgi:hypothetical protein
VNVAYRSGANAVSGSGWEFFRNTALNAQTYFKPADGSKAPLERNQFGAVLGGPIVRNRAFFFADYEGFRQDQVSGLLDVADGSPEAGCAQRRRARPRTGVVYPAGTPIPMTAFARQALGAAGPEPAGTANNYSILQNFSNHSNKAGTKVDRRPTHTWRSWPHGFGT